MQDTDIIQEGRRLVETARDKRVVMRLMGASAISLHCPKFWGFLFARNLTDLDFMTYLTQWQQVEELLRNTGCISKLHDFGTTSQSRRIFMHPRLQVPVDIFFDELSMCHRIDFKNRLEVDYPTIPVAELLLEKLQIVKIAEKDIKDTITLIREHDVGISDEEVINAQYVSELMSRDWGFYYTATTNLRRIRDEFLLAYSLKKDDAENVRGKIGELLAAIDKRPKTMRWKVRSKIGTGQKWYEEVGEVYEERPTNG